ncbi:serine/threonine-protein kinase [Brasilonema sp. UFV-L1]|uniref:serine/threonine-protein kinase n=1 Tax=Brasilonema sp. UFV-L1 TaxID=2234130 RepID=UPI00145E9763|nr:serine/threonine-protein kinase [Brasilonema sp. UFV-L1]NMG06483.1 hypothetical protein [Brasilonema sp. UFV-L1]
MSLCINRHCSNPSNADTQLFCQNCGSELLLEGRYRVVRLLGGGGFAKTYEVIERNGTVKVLKVLHLDLPKAVSLFQQEAQVLSQLDHPGIPRGNGYFTFLPNNSQEPLHCLIMEKIEGLNLEQYLQQRSYRPINQDLALEWLTQLMTILHQVHQQNFFHRDIKPSNIMLKADGQLVLIDFGTARGVTPTYIAKQPLGQVTGINSPGYTPPEQLNGQAVLTSDFFATGRTFVYLVTGKAPNDQDIYDPNTDEVHWRNYAPGTSPLLADLIDDLMRRSPSQRPQKTDVILQRLADIEGALKKQAKSGSSKNFSKSRTIQTHRRFNLSFGNKSLVMVIVGVIAASAVIMLLIPFGKSGKSNSAEQWAKNLSLVNTLRSHSEAVSSVAIAPNEQILASASHDKTIKLWNPQTGKLIRTIYGHSLPVLSLAISPDGQNLVSGSLDETIKQWNLGNGQQVRSIKADGYVAWNNAIAISKDGQNLASGSADKTIRLWNFTNGQRLRTFYGHSLPVLAVAISPSGQTLVSGSTDKTIRLWNLSTGEQLHTLSGHTGWVTCLAVSPDNQTVVSGSLDKTIKTWDIKTGALLRTLSGHSYSVLSVAISPDGQIAATGGLNGEIRLWNLETGKLLHTIAGHTKQVVSLAISQDGQTLVSGSADDTIKVWHSP